jgi:CheY-like chemotaxis protein
MSSNGPVVEMATPSVDPIRLRMRVVILDDDADRREMFRDTLASRFPHFELQFAETAGDAIRLIDEAADRLALAALDHDLDVLKTSSGTNIDAGSGLDVVDYLLRKPPAFPVLIHTTNQTAGDQMESRLRDGSWNVARVVPFGDWEWIAAAWFPAARKLIVAHVPQPRPAVASPSAIEVLKGAIETIHHVLESSHVSGTDQSILTGAICDLESRMAASHN